MTSASTPNATPKAEAAMRIAGIVLAGGKSSRMGSNKALLKLAWRDERDFLRTTHDLLLGTLGNCHISCARGQHYAGMPCLEDHWDNAGPLGAIASCMESPCLQSYDALLTLPCDMPLMRPDLLLKLVASHTQNNNGQLATLFQPPHGGRLQMLVAIYSMAAYAPIKKALLKGDYSLYRAIPAHAMRLVPYNAQNEICFINCNTPADLAKIRSLLHKSA